MLANCVGAKEERSRLERGQTRSDRRQTSQRLLLSLQQQMTPAIAGRGLLYFFPLYVYIGDAFERTPFFLTPPNPSARPYRRRSVWIVMSCCTSTRTESGYLRSLYMYIFLFWKKKEKARPSPAACGSGELKNHGLAMKNAQQQQEGRGACV